METGYIHSIETCGTVDGPGIRYVVFMQGCPLRCMYCHNPDTWNVNDGKQITVDYLINDIIKYISYMNFSGGGLTISGGEPLLQVDFLLELFKKAKKYNIHTTIDTSGFIFNDSVKNLLEYTDLVLLDIKNYNPTTYKKITGVELEPTLNFLKYLNNIGKPTWIRYVLVPNLTDNLNDINNLALYLSKYTNIEKIELLPFHKLGEYKWDALGYNYQLKDTQEPSKELIEQVVNIFKLCNLNIDDV